MFFNVKNVYFIFIAIFKPYVKPNVHSIVANENSITLDLSNLTFFFFRFIGNTPATREYREVFIRLSESNLT